VIEGRPFAVASVDYEVVGEVVVGREEAGNKTERRTNPDSALFVVHADMRGNLAELGRIGVRILVVDLAEDENGFLGSER
jgi:hypothetical protein